MHRNAERVQEALRARGARGQVIEFSASTRTSAEAAAAVGTTVAQIAKSLVFMAGGEPVLVVASGVNRVSTEKLARLMGTEISRPDGDTVKRLTGFPIGGVPPFAHDQPIATLIDQDLFGHAEIWGAAGTPNAVFPTTPQELQAITGGRVADIREEA